MEIVFNDTDLRRYMEYAVDVSPKAPILVDKYVLGKEVEVDVISDGVDCLLPGIMEHIELSASLLFDAAELLHERAHPKALGRTFTKRPDHACSIERHR